ncbi:hypothetical protein BELL_1103g00030 [Botrytis elliptica]|uniref:Uncharacterized protein n=1 Tax=Botrytis elliptica TaxID=278938 RepID=A0A4Z1ITU4_9HELO|nr:hypothetical protein BELL_1103g00030 [Botrytis elliptica]
MSSNNTIPNTPDGWFQYSTSHSLSTLPQRSNIIAQHSKYVVRDIYVDAPTAILASTSQLTQIFADVIAFSTPEITISISKNGVIYIISRVVTASGPFTITLNPASTNESAFTIYGSTFDQPISYKLNSSSTTPAIPLDLSPASGNLGAQIDIKNGEATLTYLTKYDDLSITDIEFTKCLITQLRIASIFFWTQSSLSLDLTSHVARATATLATGVLLNLQAHALGQQISSSVLTGPNINYVPVLTLSTYKLVLDDVIATASAFETQYNRFADRAAAIADQKIAWKAMLDQDEGNITLQQTLVTNSLARWNNATDFLNSAEVTMRSHQLDIRDKESDFNLGIQEWKREQIIDTIVDVFQAIFGFATAIGEIAIGDPKAAAAAPGAAESAIKVVSEAGSLANLFLKPETIEGIKGGTEAILKLYERISAAVNDVAAVDLNSAGGDVSGEDQSNADLAAIVSIAVWDKWMIQSDEQMAYAVEQKIEGAGAYQAELRRHAINGKLLVQARAQSVKIGQEYVQLWLQLQATKSNAARLQQLYDTYDGEQDAVLEVQVVLNPLKTIVEYQEDLEMIVQEVTACKENYSSDFTPFIPTIQTIDLPLNYRTSVVNALQSSSNSVTITLSPSTSTSSSTSAADTSSSLPPIAGPFIDGSRFRVFGMRAFLLGATPKPSAFSSSTSRATIRLQICTSGIYTDIQDGIIYGFTIKPLSRPFEYTVAKDGTVDLPPVKDSIIKSSDYVDPTAFAQWTVKIMNPGDLDLSGLTGLKLYWEGNARFN